MVVDGAAWNEDRAPYSCDDTGHYTWKEQNDSLAFWEVMHLVAEADAHVLVEQAAKHSDAVMNEAPVLSTDSPYESAASMTKKNGYVQEMFTPQIADGSFFVVACAYDPENAVQRQNCFDSISSFQLLEA